MEWNIYFLDKADGNQKMNLHFTFSIREISEVKDSDQVLKIPMYFTVEWEVGKESYISLAFDFISGKPTCDRREA